VALAPAHEVSPELVSLWSEAVHAARHQRGGPQLLATIRGGVDEEVLLEHLVDLHAVWLAMEDDELVGMALYRDDVIEAVFVTAQHRRRGVARMVVNTLKSLETPPKDALALPGDRATKSLYESFGWKARLLTMHAE
jgi:GNAT superfamily N-acetyltransferase